MVKKTYSVKWQKDGVDLVELAKNYWIRQMSYREIAATMDITRGQVDWNLRKINKALNSDENFELKDEIAQLKKGATRERSN